MLADSGVSSSFPQCPPEEFRCTQHYGCSREAIPRHQRLCTSQTAMTSLNLLNIPCPSEILLVVWGIFFVASRDQSSTEKGRDFSQPIERGKTIIGRKRRRTTTQTATTDPGVESDGNEQPYWSAAARGQQDAPDGSILVTPPLVSDASPGGTGFCRVSPWNSLIVY